MSQILEQQLSAFLDGELPVEELDLLLARLDREPTHRTTLARYAMIGEWVRGGAASPTTLGVADRVRATLLADAKPVPQPAPANWGGWLAGGLVAAAAVAAFLVPGRGAWRPESQAVARQDDATLQLMQEPLSSVTASVGHRLNPRAAARLTSYLVAHGEYTNQLSRSTFDSHLVTARAERASWRQSQDPASAP